jgi:hypothetical protein
MTRLTLYALSISTLFWLSSTDATLAASMGLKCSKGNVNISVSGGSCESGVGGVIHCSNSKGDSAEGVCNDSGVATCGGTSGSGGCVISRKVGRGPVINGGVLR